MTHRRRVAWTVPGGSDAEGVGQDGEVASRGDAADLADVDAE